jgi:hypothetical protein
VGKVVYAGLDRLSALQEVQASWIYRQTFFCLKNIYLEIFLSDTETVTTETTQSIHKPNTEFILIFWWRIYSDL